MWIYYAVAAAVFWGLSYAASGRVMEKGVSPVTIFFSYMVFGAAATAAILGAGGKMGPMLESLRGLKSDWVWFVITVVFAAVGALLSYMAIGEKNATMASLIEISYPLFVAIFAWVFFRDVQFNWLTILGGVMVIGGVGLVFLSGRMPG